jgi:hypothetical protein
MADWNQFYLSVKDLDIFQLYPGKKTKAISLFYKGLDQYDMDVDELRLLLESNISSTWYWEDYESFFK